MPDELVDLYDPDTGRVTGTATRERVRAQNLPHAGTAVLLTDAAGRVFVHRRSDDKDVYPGLWDCWAGGVVAAGEPPLEAARRELAEELGVTDVPLTPLFTQWYRDEHVHYLAHAYRATWDGDPVLQDDEVAEGRWVGPDELRALAADEALPFVPDGLAALRRVLGSAP